MNPKYSLIVSFLLHLKGVFVQTDTVSGRTESVCAPTGSSVTLNSTCKYPDGYTFQSLCIHRSNNGETVSVPSKDSWCIYRNDHHNCDITINDLKETDAGTYYMSFTYRKGNSTSTSVIPVEFTVHVTDLQVTVDSDGQNVTLTCKTSCPPTASKRSFIWWKNEGSAWIRLDPHHSRDELHVSAVSREDSGRFSCALESFPTFRSSETLLGVHHVVGIITLSSLLILIALLLICAALWRIRKKRQSLIRPEGKEQITQNDSVNAKDSMLAVTFDLGEKGKSVHQEELLYSHVHFSEFPNAQFFVTEAEVQYSEIRSAALY
ncbi:lachesin-like [Chanodichthys erythropterus]|uniref:lachesin-like n=1 Tax=Chanodichthys erythropterus TaxID=933992 RepID=UPI00351F69D1